MKKIYYSILTLFFATNLVAQTVPNGSFENWNNANGFPEPDGWATFNIFALFSGGDFGVTQESPGAAGDSYARLTCTADAEGLPTAAVAFTGVLDFFGGSGTTGFPVNNLPNFLSGQYRSVVNGDDIAGIACFFTRYNAAAGVTDTLALGSFEVTQSQSSWLSFDMPIVPMMAGTPDSCTIFLVAGGGNAPEVGNYLDIDDLQFTGGTNSVGELNQTRFNVWPNPMDNMLHLDLSAMENVNDVALYDAQGRVVNQWQLGATQTALDVAHLPAGCYLLHVSNRKSRWTQTILKN
jgi:hypothetical protein